MPRLARPAVLAALLVGLAACTTSPTTPDPVLVTQRAPVDAERAAVPAPVLPATWPLTGVAGESVQRPALAVKIENTAAARPQVGLEQADVVWETIVEFDVSRFVAVFHSHVPDEIGPIRSVRPVDPLIVSPLHGLLAYSGGQTGILALARDAAQVLSHDAGDAGFYRVSGRSAPHNVMGTPATFWAQADAARTAAPGEQFTFARSVERSSAVTSGTPASTLAFRLSAASRPSWSWDAASGTWLRSEGSSPATAASGARLAAVNVVSVVAPHVASGFGAQNGASVPTYELVGSGDAVVATGGKTLPVRWQKDAQDAPLRLLTAEGTAIEFNSAQVFPSCTWTPEGLARFLHHLGPQMSRRGVEVFLGTLERADDGLVERVLADPVAAASVAGVGAQWAGQGAVPHLHHAHPDLRIYQTEQECGDGANDWRHARYAWTLMRYFFSHGATAYMYWNMSLLLGGVSRWGWSQNSLFTVDPDTRTVAANHELYVLKHVSHFVRPGARVLPTLSYTGHHNQLAFAHPDGEVVLVVQNDLGTPMPLSVRLGDRVLDVTLPADS